MAIKALKPIPKGMNSVTTQLYFNGNCREAIDFYKRTFSARINGEISYSPDGGSVVYALIRIGDTNLIMSDAYPESFGITPEKNVNASLMMYTENCDMVFKKAVEEGCQVINDLSDAFWGDRIGNVRDPYGHYWSIASQKLILTPDEVTKNQEEWMKALV